jgi:nucleotide-binding universal stress UspA family protein
MRSENRDLLVVGSSYHGPQGKVSIGRLTRQLLDDFQCALAVAPRGLSERPPGRFDRIGVGYDGEPESTAALALALAMAARCGAELTICGVVDDHVPALGWPHVWLGDIITAWTEMMNSEVGKLRDMIATAVGETEVTTHSRVELGRPSHALRVRQPVR